ncbi:MAG: hypothetical protein KGJ89_02690 [Patescibacteria group bacterium]|nr:hypothetical protein [Patescibacteria group bacterium]MDE2015786.1 hypothetical protein [Patescibacteria group bacterium]MDE2226843.1 hypothetical protein [Patescibacteria group bacterium]
MIKNKKLVLAISLAGGLALAVAGLAGAQTADLAATCSGTVAQNVITWTATASGGAPAYSYIWTGTNIGGSTSSVVSATYNATGTYQAGVQVGDTTTSTVNATCSAVITSLPQTTTTPPVPQLFKNPELSINPAGQFITHGMKVVSVGTNSFVGSVWGTTWTVNLSSAPQLLFRGGNEGGHITGNVTFSQIKVGDEVGVSGRVDPNNAGVVYAQVVRDYSLLKARSSNDTNTNNGKNGENETQSENKGNNGNGNQNSNSQSLRDRIQQILDQIKGLQDKINNHG